MPAQAPEFVFGAPELFFVILASLIILASVGPKFLRERRKDKAP